MSAETKSSFVEPLHTTKYLQTICEKHPEAHVRKMHP